MSDFEDAAALEWFDSTGEFALAAELGVVVKDSMKCEWLRNLERHEKFMAE